ncbi:MAG: hypothetical protein ACLQNE_37705, partial [Thermoguttaceae bacterium]
MPRSGTRPGVYAGFGIRQSLNRSDPPSVSPPSAVVESIADGLALLPLRQPMTATEAVLKYLAQDL